MSVLSEAQARPTGKIHRMRVDISPRPLLPLPHHIAPLAPPATRPGLEDLPVRRRAWMKSHTARPSAGGARDGIPPDSELSPTQRAWITQMGSWAGVERVGYVVAAIGGGYGVHGKRPSIPKLPPSPPPLYLRLPRPLHSPHSPAFGTPPSPRLPLPAHTTLTTAAGRRRAPWSLALAPPHHPPHPKERCLLASVFPMLHPIVSRTHGGDDARGRIRQDGDEATLREGGRSWGKHGRWGTGGNAPAARESGGGTWTAGLGSVGGHRALTSPHHGYVAGWDAKLREGDEFDDGEEVDDGVSGCREDSDEVEGDDLGTVPQTPSFAWTNYTAAGSGSTSCGQGANEEQRLDLHSLIPSLRAIPAPVFLPLHRMVTHDDTGARAPASGRFHVLTAPLHRSRSVRARVLPLLNLPSFPYTCDREPIRATTRAQASGRIKGKED
ncbi:hypothetical protein C8J57DRAFT_1238844 [Mycena rebaudengoi]|nr:hypothetical protein C8J57DRAFT_1238844 [Mycena rebaudengoi]